MTIIITFEIASPQSVRNDAHCEARNNPKSSP